MSKKQYKETFSKLHPSDESIERIMSMTDKKYVVGVRKALIIAATVISILCSVALAANAATDGAVADSVSEALETVSKKITIMVKCKENGKETEKEAELTVTHKTDSDGNDVYEFEAKIDSDPNVPFEINTASIDSYITDEYMKDLGQGKECVTYIITATEGTEQTAKEK